MSFKFLDFLDKYEGEKVDKVKSILEQKKSKIDSIIKEAFYGDFVTKSEAILNIKTDFINDKKAPKSIDVKFLKENLKEVVDKVSNLSEGEIKIIINNDVNKGGKTSSTFSLDDSDLEESVDKKKRGRPSKKSKTDKESIQIAEKIAKKNKKNLEAIEEEVDLKEENDEEQIEENVQMYVVKATVGNQRDKVVSGPMDKTAAEAYKKNLEASMTSAADDFKWKDLKVVPQMNKEVEEQEDEIDEDKLTWESVDEYNDDKDNVEEEVEEENYEDMVDEEKSNFNDYISKKFESLKTEDDDTNYNFDDENLDEYASVEEESIEEDNEEMNEPSEGESYDENDQEEENEEDLDNNQDLKEDMVNFLKSEFGDEENDFDMEAAIYWFANDYHEGQNSELYSILSTSDFSPSPLHNNVEDEDEIVQMMYQALVDNYTSGE